MYNYWLSLNPFIRVLPILPKTTNQNVNEIMSSPQASSGPQPPGLLPSSRCVPHLPQHFRDLLLSNPILLRQYSEADEHLKTAWDEAHRLCQSRSRIETTFEEDNPPDEVPAPDYIKMEPDSMGSRWTINDSPCCRRANFYQRSLGQSWRKSSGGPWIYSTSSIWEKTILSPFP